jgi:hypothetical protein
MRIYHIKSHKNPTIDSIICKSGLEVCEVKRLHSIRPFQRCSLMGCRAMLKGKVLPTGLLDLEDKGTTWQVFTTRHGADSRGTETSGSPLSKPQG